jgi:uncharacterized membrane protein YkoI
MKLKILVLAASLAVLASCGPSYKATDQYAVVIPAGTQTAFTTQYPTASTVVWSRYDVATLPIDWELAGWPTMDQNDYVVSFNMDNDKYYAWYDSDGNWIGTAYVVIDYKSLPSVVNSTINSQFSGYTITGVNKEFQKDRMVYEVRLQNGDNKVKMLIDANGNIIKQKTVMK